MRTKPVFETLHEVGEWLIELGRFLKSCPDRRLPELAQPVEGEEQLRAKSREHRVPVDIRQFAMELRSLTKEEAKSRLLGLTVERLKEICKLHNVPVVDKKRKEAIVNRILYELFDYQEGHRLVREFGLGGSNPFHEAVAFYRANKERLLQEYEGKFVAIMGGQVVDSDENFPRLAERVYQKFGYQDIFMPKVDREPSPVHLPSPRLRGGAKGA